MGHTILFIHPKRSPLTRTYKEYESIKHCLESISMIYEEHLKRQSPDLPTITYDILQLFDFIDSFVDISCVVYQQSTDSYAPYGREWIKNKIYEQFREFAVKTEY
ncbi:hypothetical protein KR222_000201 [Zaprionus bogoriensis]|nr:hypothetical protein KR222_000201 [Zaprionus bogoriensis]